MIRIGKLQQLPAALGYAVIINCGTKWHTTLALASCIELTDMPVLLIDCESDDGSEVHFGRLGKALGLSFFWLDWPLRPHGLTLDLLLSEIPAQRVLLVDSDLEIASERLVGDLHAALDAAPDAYGAGFLHGAGWMGPPEHRLPPWTAYHMERMWIPLVLLDVDKIRHVLGTSVSFLARRDYTELGGGEIARLLAHRFRLPGLRRLRFPDARGTPGPAPAWLEYDTGARVHEALRAAGFRFAALPEARWSEARHDHGVTRARLAGPLMHVAQTLGVITRNAGVSSEAQARERLREISPAFWQALAGDDISARTTSVGR